MSSPSRFERLSLLPPYVLARVDEIKNRLRAEGRDIFDFGLGNPDGPAPKAAVERSQRELLVSGSQRYMPSRGLPEVRQAICDWYARRYGQTFDPDSEAVATIGSKEGIAHLMLAVVGQGDCVLVPDPAYPIHRYGVVLAGGEPISVKVAPGLDHLAEIEAALQRSPRPPKGLVVNFPHNPSTAVADAPFFAGVVALARRHNLWVISDLAYADLPFDDRPAPSIMQVPGARDVAVEFFTVSKSYNMPGFRVGFAVGGRELIGALTTIKGYVDYGMLAPTQLAAATALRDCDAHVVEIRALYKHRARVLTDALAAAGWQVAPPASTMFLWAPLPERFRAGGALDFSTRMLEQAGVAVAPGVGFGPGGEGHVRFSLIENDDRVRAAAAAIGKFLTA